MVAMAQLLLEEDLTRLGKESWELLLKEQHLYSGLVVPVLPGAGVGMVAIIQSAKPLDLPPDLAVTLE